MPDINFRLTATDEATPVIDRLRRKMDGMNRPGASSGGSARSSGGSSGNAGTGGFLGSGKIGGMAGLAIIAQAAVQVLQKVYQKLLEASPYLQSVSQQFKTAMNIYLRPLGDSIAKALQAKSEYALEKADERAKQIEALDEEFGVVGAALGTFGFILYDVKMALWEFNYGVWNMLSKVWLWPIDKLGDILGVDLPGSLTELLDSVFGIKGGFQGIQEWMENLPEALAGLGTDIWNGITGAFSDAWDEITGFGTWLWKSLTKGFAGITNALSGFGNWLWDGVTGVLDSAWDTLTGLGTEIWDGITGVFDTAWTYLTGLGTEIWNGITGAFSDAWDEITGFGTWLWTGITGTLDDAWETISGFGTWLYDSVTGVFNTAWTALTGFGTWLYNAATGVFNTAWTYLTGLGTEIWDGITGVFDTAWTYLSGFGSWLWNGITGALGSAWNVLSGFGSWLYNSLKSSLGGIGYEAYKAFHNAIASLLNGVANIELPLVGKPFKGLFGTIPMLASGGIVTQPTLAMIGEAGPEAVVPLSKGGMGQSVTIEINAPIYGVTDLESAIDQAIRRASMGYGYR